jgi:hypothetical protein
MTQNLFQVSVENGLKAFLAKQGERFFSSFIFVVANGFLAALGAVDVNAICKAVGCKHGMSVYNYVIRIIESVLLLTRQIATASFLSCQRLHFLRNVMTKLPQRLRVAFKFPAPSLSNCLDRRAVEHARNGRRW